MIPATQDFENLGVFYLGRRYDLAKGELQDDLILYDSKDLCTHAVCVGMTGSDKTGLCIALLEEAAIDGIPAIVIDPKGDLSNLLLTFPGLKPGDFLPWVNEPDANKRGQTLEEFAKGQAELWQKGLAEWGEDGARIKRLRDAADFAVYTPGSNAGLPVSILKSFAVPEPAILTEAELLRERISTAATSLLGLLGIEADPVRSREHILIATIFHHLWKEGKEPAGLHLPPPNGPGQRRRLQPRRPDIVLRQLRRHGDAGESEAGGVKAGESWPALLLGASAAPARPSGA